MPCVTISSFTTSIMRFLSLFLTVSCFLASPVQAQEADPEDVASIESIIAATNASIERAPGQQFNWDRFRTLFIPDATLIPNTEQRNGQFSVISPEEFIVWIETNTPIGGPNDRGFAEEGYHNEIDRYGDIANVMSSYQKHYWNETEILGRGVNSFQLVHNNGRWWVVSIIWDENYAAGPIPDKFGGEPEPSASPN